VQYPFKFQCGLRQNFLRAVLHDSRLAISGGNYFKTVYFRTDSVLNVKHEQANSVMDYDLGHFDLKTRVLEPLENPRGAKVLPMS
jgi:hypothetical protein